MIPAQKTEEKHCLTALWKGRNKHQCLRSCRQVSEYFAFRDLLTALVLCLTIDAYSASWGRLHSQLEEYLFYVLSCSPVLSASPNLVTQDDDVCLASYALLL